MNTTIDAKPAATVLLLRESEEKALEVLLLRRNKALKFASGFWVFPGGKIEESDGNEINNIESALKAGIRETEEETGIMLKSNDLTFFAHWTTPEKQKIRFGTYFFIANISDLNTKVNIDQSEILEYRWLTPVEAIHQMKEGEIAMLPPTFMTLSRIQNANNFKKAYENLTSHPPLYILPKIVIKEDQIYCLYKGDSAYEDSKVHGNGPRHRLVSNFKFSHYTFEYSGCDDITCVHGNF